MSFTAFYFYLTSTWQRAGSATYIHIVNTLFVCLFKNVLQIPRRCSFWETGSSLDNSPLKFPPTGVWGLCRPPTSSSLIINFVMLRLVSGISSLYLFVNLILVPVLPFSTHLFFSLERFGQ